MQFGLINTLANASAECLVLGFFSDVQDEENAQYPKLRTKLTEAGDTLWHIEPDGRALLLVHCGQHDDFNKKLLSKRLNDICSALMKQRIVSATISLPRVNMLLANNQLSQMLLQVDAFFYQLTDFKTKNKKEHKLTNVTFYLPEADNEGIKIGLDTALGVALTRKLADLPANHCTPTYLAEKAVELAEQHSKISTTIHKLDDIKSLKMGAFLSVAQGSEHPPCFIEMHYNGGGDEAPIVLVGKGVTFDSGGLSLKPANVMDEMKYDMAGAASVMGTLHTCALLNLPVNVIGLMPCTENLPSGRATKPGDIVTSMSGQTIEILNTDAEGRLILADALTYAERFNPQYVIDIATLTGAVIVSLGYVATGLMTNDEELADEILRASRESGDRVWRLPLDDDYQDALDSPLADMINASFDRTAGSITGGCFLQRYTEKFRWAHLDVAGTAWVTGKKRVATGRPVPLLVQLLRHAASTR